MKIRSKVTIGLLSSVMCVAALAHAAGYKKAGPDKVTFETKAVGMTIAGSVPGIEFIGEKKDNGQLLFKANLEGLKTGIGERDVHARETLQTKKNKYASLTLDPSKFKNADGTPKTGKALEGTASLTLVGKSAPVKLTYDAKTAGNKLIVDATFTVNLEAHGIKPPCKYGVCVSKDSLVTVHVELAPQ